MDRLACLHTISEISEKMLAATRSSQWDDLLALEARERELIGHFRSLTGSIDREISRQLIRSILNNHSAIMALAQPLHQDLKVLLEAFPEATGIK